MDSDVLFFKRPDEIIKFINNKSLFFMSGNVSAYSIQASELEKHFGFPIISKVNARLFYMSNQ